MFIGFSTLFGLIGFLFAVPAPGHGNPVPATILKMSVYPDNPASGAQPDFRASLQTGDMQILSARRISPDRPLLVVIDPASFSRSELRQRLDGLAQAFAAPTGLKPSSVRIGVAVLDGVLSDPVPASASKLGEALDRVFEGYASVKQDAEPGRFVDIAAALVGKAEADGPVDCLLVAGDAAGKVEPVSGDYMKLAVERRLVEASLRKGSTFYGLFGSAGMLSESVAAAGGIAFEAAARTAPVLTRIADARTRGYVLDSRFTNSAGVDGRLGMKVHGPGSAGVRAPLALWACVHGRSLARIADVVEAQDRLRRAKSAEGDNDLDGAAALIGSAIALDDANPSVLVAGLKLALRQRNFVRASEFAVRAANTRPMTDAAALAMTASLVEGGGSRIARDVLAALPAGGEGVPAVAYARLLTLAGEYPRAVDAFRRAVRDGAPAYEICGDSAWALLKSGDEPGARDQIRSCGDDEARTVLVRSELHRREGNLGRALEEARRAAKLLPNDADARIHLAEMRVENRQWDEAVTDFDAAASIDPGRTDVLPMRVRAEISAGRVAEAARLLSRGLSGIRDTAGYREIADLQAGTGNLGDAAKTLETGAAAVSDGRYELFVKAAEIRERRAEFGQALLDYRAALGAAPPEKSAGLMRGLSSHIRYLSALMADPEEETARGKPPDGAKQNQDDLLIPGGVELLARTIGIDAAAVKDRSAVERVFAHILDAGAVTRDNDLSRTLVTALKNYESLVRRLVKLNLIHPDQDLATPQNLVFPLTGPDVPVAKTREFLAFFSVRYKPGKGTGPATVEIQQGKSAEEKQRLLRNLGVDLMNRNMRELRITLRNDRVPMMLGSGVWGAKIIGGTGPESLLRRMVSSTELMKLYIGLSRCSAEARSALLDAGLGRDLVPLANAIGVYGRYLQFSDGKLVLPGSTPAWEAVVGLSHSNATAFLALLLKKDQGRALVLYEGLGSASKPVRDYLTESPRRLLELYQLLAPFDSSRLVTWYGDAGRQNLGRVLRLLTADAAGLHAPFAPAFIAQISAPRTAGNSAEEPKDRVDLPTVISLMTKAPPSSVSPFYTPADTLELLSYLKSARPASLDGNTMSLLLQNPSQTPVFLDLIWDVNAAPDVLMRYLAYCRDLVQTREKDWNNNKTRSSQALFVLLSVLCREKILEPARANAILSDALSRFDTANEAAFARNLASILSDQILPAVVAAVGDGSGDDPVLRALAGTVADETFRFEGRDFRLAGSAFRLQRMKTSIQQQSIVPLQTLLDLYAVLGRLASKPEAAESDRAAELLKAVASAQRLKDVTKDGLRSVAHADVDAMLGKLEAARTQRAAAAAVADAIASELHVELGVTLLSYCYADNATPDIDLLTFDPHFIRKHRFYPDIPGTRSFWRQAYLDQSDTAGSIMTGSLSGLDRELARL